MSTDLITHIAGLPRPALVTIDGRSGAGKTTLAATIAAGLAPQTATATIEMEELCQGWDDLAGAVERARALAPTLGREQIYDRWDWRAGRWRPAYHTPAPVTILVGCGAGQVEADYAIWVDAPEELRRQRVARRDPYDWSEHWESWAAQETELLGVRDARALADAVVTAGG